MKREPWACILLTVLLGASISCCVLTTGIKVAHAQTMQMETPMRSSVSVPGGNNITTVEAANQNIRAVLRKLAQEGGFNLVIDDSVNGNVSMQLQKVTINNALEALSGLTGVELFPRSGNIYLAISREAAQEKGLSRQVSKVIKIRYGNANRITSLLNSSILADASAASGASGAATNTAQKARTDSRTNSIIVVGTPREIELAEDAVARLDQPRKTKTFYLSHANALDVATMLASGIFNDGTNALGISNGGSSLSGGSSGGGAGGTTSGGATPSPLRVEQEDIREGSGINDLMSANAGGNGGGGGGGGAAGGGGGGALSQNIVLRGSVKSTQTVNVSSEGPMVIPDTRSNAITIMGTVEQIALAERMIPTLDAQLPQVAIEASLIEISEDGQKELGNALGVSDGRLQFGFNNQAVPGNVPKPGIPTTVQPANTGLTGIPTVSANDSSSLARSAIGFSTNPFRTKSAYISQLRALVTTSRAKLLANPTVVATHDSEAIISIVDEIIRSVIVTVDGGSGTTQTVINLGEAGIVLDILPKIGDDGTITMRVRPSVSTIREVTTDSAGNTITLLNKRDFLAQQVRLRDGETLLLGGLIQESENKRNDKLPGVGDLPIVGALFRASQNTKSRTELVMLITPHIINKTQYNPVRSTEPLLGVAK